MGNYYFADSTGKETKVEYTFGYVRDISHKLRINLHHSSIPYEPSHSTAQDSVGEQSHVSVTDYAGDKSSIHDSVGSTYPPISEEEVYAAQKAWADEVIRVGVHYQEGSGYFDHAAKFVDSMYAYDLGDVLFKPTLATVFRLTRDGAISYMVGGNKKYPADHGFALKPWVAIRWDNAGVILQGQSATAMGNYYFTDLSGKETKVEYTFGYIRDAGQKLRINLHHSSIPYSH
jgi:hypothetical protein